MRFQFPVSRLMPWMLGALLALGGAGLSGCEGQGDDDDNLNSKNDNNDNSDLGNDDAHDGNGQENFTDNDEKGASKDSADVNSATGDAAATDSLDSTLDGKDGAKDNATPPPANNAAANPPAGKDAGGAPPAPAKEGTAPVAGGRVRYIKEGGIQAVNAPNGTPVMTIDQGEHPVTWEENGFLKIANGLYVPVDSTSDKGVPRPANPNRWTK